MKKFYLLLILNFIVCDYLPAQILCINCYNQNDSISHNVNNLLLNGGFENTTCQPWPVNDVFCPNSLSYSCDISDWACTGGGNNTYVVMADTGSNISFIGEGAKSAYFGNSVGNACSNIAGDTSCMSEMLCSSSSPPAGYPVSGSTYGGSAGVSLEQTVSGLVAGNTYVLEFWTGGESNGPSFHNDGLFAVDIGFGKTFLRDPETPLITGIGRTFVIQFNATSPSHIIKFTNWGHVCSNCSELVLDNVRVYTLAELDSSVSHCTTFITETTNTNEQFEISPNPVKDMLTISSKQFEENKSIEIKIFDVLGKEILSQQLLTPTYILHTANFVKGMYLINIDGEKINVTKKFVVE